jgi:hypothetical protein
MRKILYFFHADPNVFLNTIVVINSIKDLQASRLLMSQVLANRFLVLFRAIILFLVA